MTPGVAVLRTVEAPHRLVLTRGMPPGLFRGVRTYTPPPDGTGTPFRMDEECTGPMRTLIRRSRPDLQPSLDVSAAGPEQRVESDG